MAWCLGQDPDDLEIGKALLQQVVDAIKLLIEKVRPGVVERTLAFPTVNRFCVRVWMGAPGA
jgi:hypothetical protein